MLLRATVVSTLIAMLGGCAATPEEIAARSDYDVCRGVMGGFQRAEQERARRGLDCRPYYGAIAAKEQADNQAVNNYLRSIQPPPQMRCTSSVIGNQVYTNCR